MDLQPVDRASVQDALSKARTLLERWIKEEEALIHKAHIHNPWFTPDFQRMAFQGLADMLSQDAVQSWLDQYPHPSQNPQRVGLVMAGNLPLVGLHDLFCIIAAGHGAKIKTSSQDDVLPREFVAQWTEEVPWLAGRIEFVAQLKDFDAVIATGSSNTSRYFEYYFGKYPSIVRKNRNSVAVLTGEETEEDLDKLADDVFLYFGFGCRSVSSLLIPEEYELGKLAKAFTRYEPLGMHNKFANNLDYHRALFLLNQEPFYDLGGILLRLTQDLHSPGAVVNLIYYKTLEEAAQWVKDHADSLQVVVTKADIPGATDFGQSQKPSIGDYADGIDTMEFLHGL